MKNLFFVKVLLVSVISMAIVSCSDDDEPNSVSGEKIPTGQKAVDLFIDIANDELVFVKGGSFLMGAQAQDPNSPNYDIQATKSESPVHQVAISSFYLMKNEVTQALWEYVVNNVSPDSMESSMNTHPICNVSYEKIINEFIPKLNKMTGIAYRLPTEAEWEYAARGGQEDSYTSSMGVIGEYLKFAGSNNSSLVACWGLNEVAPIKTKLPNALGVYDMSGNVWEWCSDWFSTQYSSNNTTNPQGASSGDKRVLRGGDWSNIEFNSRVSYRSAVDPDHSCEHIGFRLAVSAL